MMFINHIGIQVSDMDGMLEFYRKAFGFEVARVISTGEPVASAFADANGDATARRPRVVLLRAANCYLEIVETFDRGEDGARHAGYVQLCMEVPNVESEYQRLKEAGIEFAQASPIDLGYVKVLTGFDPEGNQIEIVETRPDYVGSSDRVVRELVPGA
ncbi:MAG TPA: VOC family protein [Afipia sp.]